MQRSAAYLKRRRHSAIRRAAADDLLLSLCGAQNHLFVLLRRHAPNTEPIQIDRKIARHGDIARQAHASSQRNLAAGFADLCIVRAADSLGKFRRRTDVVVVQLAGGHKPDVPGNLLAVVYSQIVPAAQKLSANIHEKV